MEGQSPWGGRGAELLLSGEGALTKAQLEVSGVSFGAFHFGDLLKSTQALLPPHPTPYSGYLSKIPVTTE